MTTKEDIVRIVNGFLVEDFEIPVEKLIPTARLREDVGIDSLDVVDVIISVDEKFGVRLTNQEMASLRTLDDFYNLIVTKMP
ncbi:MAG: acyl carrier protein [Paludibacteraceae bacterium]|nr:acyl carrier protein [Paludibacteraceae bacterium]